MKPVLVFAAVMTISSVAIAEEVNVAKDNVPIQMSATEMDQVVAGRNQIPHFGLVTAFYGALNHNAANGLNGLERAWENTGDFCAGGGIMHKPGYHC